MFFTPNVIWTKTFYTIILFLSNELVDKILFLCIILVIFALPLRLKRRKVVSKKSYNRPCQRVIDKRTDRICGHPVSGGGNMHEDGQCPPAPKPGDNRWARKHKARNKAKANAPEDIKRGAPLAGIHKKAASSPGTATKKA